jgi:hypothetical protein
MATATTTAIRKVQENQVGLKSNGTHQLLAYTLIAYKSMESLQLFVATSYMNLLNPVTNANLISGH